MTRNVWLRRISKILIGLMSGSTLIGTSCGSDIRDSITSAGLDFVQSTTGSSSKSSSP